MQDSNAKDIMERQLGRFERLSARKGVKRLPNELQPGETIVSVAIGEVPRDGVPKMTVNAEFAVLAATSRRLLVVSGLRAESVSYDRITGVSVEHPTSGYQLTVELADAEPLLFRNVAPGPHRVSELAAAIGAAGQASGATGPERMPSLPTVVPPEPEIESATALTFVQPEGRRSRRKDRSLVKREADAASKAFDEFQGLVVGRVGAKAMEEIRRSCGPGETPEFIIGEGMAGALVAFTDRCMIIKKGAMSNLMAGSLGGGRVATFMYFDITGIEYNSGWLSGVLEILTASYQGSANKDFWRGTMQSRNANSNDPWTLSNTLPLSKSMFETARPQIDALRRMIAEAKRPGSRQSPSPTGAFRASPLADELGRLAELHRSGALDDDEFRQAKQALLAKASQDSA